MKKNIFIILLTISFNLTFSQQDSIYVIKNLKTSNNMPGMNSLESRHAKVFNNLIYFFGKDDIALNTELCVSDGTFNGTEVIQFTNPTNQSISYLNDVLPTAIFDNKFVFQAKYDANIGEELYYTEGPASGISLFYDFVSSSGTNGNPSHLMTINNLLVVRAKTTTNNNSYKLHIFDENGLDLILNDYTPMEAEPVYFDGKIAYSCIKPQTVPLEYGILLIDSFGNSEWKPCMLNGQSDFPRYLTVADSSLYFQHYTAFTGYELFRITKNSSIASLVSDYSIGSPSSYAQPLGFLNNKLIFNALNSLIVYDEILDSIYQINDFGGLNSGFVINESTKPTYFNNELYFVVDINNQGRQLWKTDGSSLGTVLLKNIFPGSNNANPNNLFVFNGLLYFAATNALGSELWKTDGTEINTNIVFDFNKEPNGSSSPNDFIVYQNELYFGASETFSIGNELCKLTTISTSTINLDLGNDTTVCASLSFILTTGIDASIYPHIWNNGSTSATIFPDSTGSYWVDVYNSNNQLIASDTINIIFEDVNFSLGNDTAIFNSFEIIPNQCCNIFWNTGQNSPTLIVNNSGNFSATFISNNNCIYTDDITVNIDSLDLPNFLVFCPNQTTIIQSNLGVLSNYHQVWSTGDTSSFIHPTISGSYWLNIYDLQSNLVSSDTCEVLLENINFSLGNDTVVSTNSFTISSNANNGSYQWSDNSTNDELTVFQSGIFSVVYTSEMGCVYNDDIEVTFDIPNNIKDELLKDVKVYPNPFIDKIMIEIKNTKLIDYEVCDLLGRSVLKGNSNLIFTNTLNSGNYLLKIRTNSGTLIYNIFK